MDEPPLPSPLAMLMTFAASEIRDVRNGRRRVPLAIAQARHEICKSNEGRCPTGRRRPSDDRCSGCGCRLWQFKGDPPEAKTGKVWRPRDPCPDGHWPTYDGPTDEVAEEWDIK